MGVLKLRPHYLRCIEEVKGGYTDDNGDYHDGEASWGEPIRCDIVPNGSGATRAFADGVVSTYAYTVHSLPTNMRDLNIGERVLCCLYGQEKEFVIKGFHRYQTHCKAWL